MRRGWDALKWLRLPLHIPVLLSSFFFCALTHSLVKQTNQLDGAKLGCIVYRIHLMTRSRSSGVYVCHQVNVTSCLSVLTVHCPCWEWVWPEMLLRAELLVPQSCHTKNHKQGSTTDVFKQQQKPFANLPSLLKLTLFRGKKDYPSWGISRKSA